jgi:uncharacterized delta-60 repeat protein
LFFFYFFYKNQTSCDILFFILNYFYLCGFQKNIIFNHLNSFNMKKFIYSFVFTLCAVSLFAQSGILDNTFGTKGVKTVAGDAISLLGDLYTFDVSKDGKVVFMQNANNSLDTPTFFIKRTLPNGANDATFGKNGVVKLDETSLKSAFIANSLKIAADGKIYIIGFGAATFTALSADAAVLRLNTNGTFDNTFGTNGIAYFSVPNTTEFAISAVLQTDGKILLNLFLNDVEDSFSVARLNTNGTKDNTFGTNGLFTYKPTKAKAGTIAVVETVLDKQGNAYIYFNYEVKNETPIVPAIVKIDAAGKIVNTFGQLGLLEIYTGTKISNPTGIALQSNGKILTSVNFSLGPVDDNVLYRYDSNGKLDVSFGTNGAVEIVKNPSIVFTNPSDLVYGFKIMQGNDKILVNSIGISNDTSFVNVLRYNANGTKDNTFGKNGAIKLPTDTLDYDAMKMVVQEGTNSIFVMTQAKGKIDLNQFIKILNPFGVATKENIEVRNFSVYPTLVETDATLTYDLDQTETVTIQLIDMQGRVLENYLSNQLQSAGKYQQSITMPSTMPNGVYSITLTNSKGSTSAKIIK